MAEHAGHLLLGRDQGVLAASPRLIRGDGAAIPTVAIRRGS
jgi:hypothetical protein